MRFDLGRLPVEHVDAMLKFCIANRIDYDKAVELRAMWYTDPLEWPEYYTEDGSWVLQVPDKIVTFLTLKWSK